MEGLKNGVSDEQDEEGKRTNEVCSILKTDSDVC
jgi:hypothetical protein